MLTIISNASLGAPLEAVQLAEAAPHGEAPLLIGEAVHRAEAHRGVRASSTGGDLMQIWNG